MLPYFSVTLFVSALLLFLVQPMIGKMILPLLGGTPAVWNTCMVFFQAILLVGYAYTHTLSTWQPPRRQLLIQALLLFFPLLVLPFAVGAWTPPTESNPIFAVLLLLLGMVGLPFFVVSTSAPLLQKWFGHTGHPAARDPYFLYGASNLGSMLALLAYPIVVEPNFGVDAQVRLWTAGYSLFVLLVLGCAIVLWNRTAPTASLEAIESHTVDEKTAIMARARRHRAVTLDAPLETPAAAEAVSWGRRLRWIGLAAAPSSLMLGVTTYMTTDIAAVPFFWVTPLALYLATFIVVFARWPVVWTTWPHAAVLYLQPCFVLLLMLQIMAALTPKVWTTPIMFTLHLTAFLFTALMCHGELAHDRPSARHLTEFYLCMSFGGVLGGLFNALFAPLAFQYDVWEYPLAMVFAYLLRPELVGNKPLFRFDSSSARPTTMGRVLDVAVAPVLALATCGLIHVVETTRPLPWFITRSLVLAAAIVVVFTLLARPLRCGLALLTLFCAVTVYDRLESPRPIFEGRGFFGLLRVKAADESHWLGVFQPTSFVGFGAEPWSLLAAVQPAQPDVDFSEERVYHTLIHGGINHGRQIVVPKARRTEPVAYFHPTNGIGEVFGRFSWPAARLPASLAGMGCDPWSLLLDLEFSEPPYAVLGLGTGTLAAYARPTQAVHFYEIDPLVRRLSLPADGQEPAFYFVRDALERGARLEVILGDGRLQIAKAPDKYYHIITLDAFSSDAIPVHLLTKEALQLYLDKLADGGMLVFNATNRFVDIRGVLSALARDLDLDCLYCVDYTVEGLPDKYSADWMVMQRRYDGGSGLAPLRARLPERWEEFTPLPGRVWTDNFSNLFRVLQWR